MQLFFFQGDHNTKQKKIVQKSLYNQPGCIIEPYNANKQPELQFCQKNVKGRHAYVRAKPRPSRSVWAENIANAWLPHGRFNGILSL